MYSNIDHSRYDGVCYNISPTDVIHKETPLKEADSNCIVQALLVRTSYNGCNASKLTDIKTIESGYFIFSIDLWVLLRYRVYW